MGWLPPWWPNLSLKVLPPKAWPRIWCPMQMPNTGFLPRMALALSTAYGAADGSPCKQQHMHESWTLSRRMCRIHHQLHPSASHNLALAVLKHGYLMLPPAATTKPQSELMPQNSSSHTYWSVAEEDTVWVHCHDLVCRVVCWHHCDAAAV